MAMITSDPTITLLNDVKPYKTSWKVEVKVLHSLTQHSSYSGGDSLQFILADKTGVKIHCTCKRLFFARVKKLQLGQWRFIENFSLTAAAGKYRPTSHKYKMSILSNSNVTNSILKDEDNFLSLTSFTEIMNGSLDSNFLIDVIGQPIDIGDIQVVPVQGKETEKLEFTLTDTEDHQIACCLWGRFAEHMLYAYKVAQANKNFLYLLRFAKINVYKGQVQITNAFDSSTIGDLMSKTIYKCCLRTSLLSQLVVMSLQNIKEANANLINGLFILRDQFWISLWRLMSLWSAWKVKRTHVCRQLHYQNERENVRFMIFLLPLRNNAQR
ncbi:unnamed protein product [Brassica oleracea]